MNYIYAVREMVKTIFLAVVTLLILLVMIIGAILQQSYRTTPPSDAELADDPSLIVYRGE